MPAGSSSESTRPQLLCTAALRRVRAGPDPTKLHGIIVAQARARARAQASGLRRKRMCPRHLGVQSDVSRHDLCVTPCLHDRSHTMRPVKRSARRGLFNGASDSFSARPALYRRSQTAPRRRSHESLARCQDRRSSSPAPFLQSHLQPLLARLSAALSPPSRQPDWLTSCARLGPGRVDPRTCGCSRHCPTSPPENRQGARRLPQSLQTRRQCATRALRSTRL